MILTLMKIKLGALKKIIAEAKKKPVKKPAKKSNKITVTLDLDALKRYATKVAAAGGGSLESSGGETPSGLAQAWDGMYSLFTGVNKGFASAVSKAISVLEDAHSDEEYRGDRAESSGAHGPQGVLDDAILALDAEGIFASQDEPPDYTGQEEDGGVSANIDDTASTEEIFAALSTRFGKPKKVHAHGVANWEVKGTMIVAQDGLIEVVPL
jgi:hypothetical protein